MTADEKAGLEGQLGPARTYNLEGSSSVETVSAATDSGRGFWVSIDPPLGVPSVGASLWRVFVYASGSEGGRLVTTFDSQTVEQGWSALHEIDQALRILGWARTGVWQIGSGRGFVAWLGLDADALLESFRSEIS